MADITDFSSVSGEELSEAQILGIINRIDLNVFNILANKWDAVPYAEFGSAGHRKDPDKLLKELRQLRAMYVAKLQEIPAFEVTVWDDPHE